jgi:O-antigen/teichoic acid export membrane protein
MFGFSSRLLGTDLLNNIYESVPQMIIGRIHGAALGHYDQARQIRDYPVKSTVTSMQAVIFPALASIREDGAQFERAVSRTVGAAVFVMFPVMAGLVVVADDVFRIFLAPQWQPSVPFFRILCLAGLVVPLSIISSNILRTRSDGRDVLRSEVIKKVIATAILVATVPLGAEAIVWGVVGIAFADAAVSFTLARRQSAYGFRALGRDAGPVLALTAAMAAAVWLPRTPIADMVTGALTGTAFGSTKLVAAVVLAVKIALGAAVYGLGALALRLEAMREFLDILRRAIAKVREKI